MKLLINMKLGVRTFSLFMLLSTDALPFSLRLLRKVEKSKYILVPDTETSSEDARKSAKEAKNALSLKAESLAGKCAFKYEFDRDFNRRPRYLNVAVLKNPSYREQCIELTYDFTVLEKCTNCGRRHSVLYKYSTQKKVIGYIEPKINT